MKMDKMTTGREPTLQNATDTIVRQAIHISQLEADNAALRNELENYRKAQNDALIPGRVDETDVPVIESTVKDSETTSGTASSANEKLAQRCSELQAKLAAIKSEHAKCGKQLEVFGRKYQQAKESCQAWKDYTARKHSEREACRCQYSEPPPSDRHESSVQDDPMRTPKAIRFTKDTTSNDQIITSSELLANHAPTSSTDMRPHRVSSSQTTVFEPDEHDNDPHFDNQDPDDQPEVVSARPVKRRAGWPAPSEPASRRVKVKQEPESPTAAIELSSDPLGSIQTTPERNRLADLSDLDVVGPPIITPRINRKQRELASRAMSEEVARPPLLQTSSSLSDSELLNLEAAERAGNARVEDRRNQPADEPVAALRPLSVNVPTSPRAKATKAKATRLRRSGAKDNLALLSEDGDDRASQSVTGAQQRHGKGQPDDLRLDGLLNERPLDKTPTFLNNRPHPSKTKPGALATPHFPTPVSTIKRTSPAKRRSPIKRNNMPMEPPPNIKPEQEPLRIRPPETLQLRDFKINPKYMGTNFAWADTLRGKEQRRNLHTCTRADCCGGALSKAIAIGGVALSGKTDAQALEQYLGRDYENHIAAYSAEQKKQIITQAHAYCFAEKHGKHRQAFEKPSTPPGFWNTDFPSTQETAENRKKAEEMEREEVAARWREAMRDNGRWMFRDE